MSNIIGQVFRFVAIAVFLASAAYSAGQEYSQRIWRLEDGLPNGRVQAISQTADGYLWIGTSGGLVRFDGLRFVIFDRSNTPEFADDSVLTLLAPKDGSLWVGTEGGGLLHYDNRKFTRYSTQHGLTNLFVRSIHEDRKKTLWVGTDRGIFRKDEDRFVRLDGTAEIPFVNGLDMYEEPSGDLLVGGNGLYRIRNGRLTPLSPHRGARAILERPDGSQWIAATDGLFERRSNQMQPIHRNIASPMRLLIDNDGNTWIGTAQGLYLSRGNEVWPYGAAQSLPDEFIMALYCDRENNIWIGSRNGLVRLSRKLVTTLTGTGDDAMFTVYKDPRNRMWLVAGDGDLYELVNGQLAKRSVPGLPKEASIRTVFEDRNGCFWVGTINEGFFRTRCGPVQVFNMAKGLRNNGVRAFVEDRAGNLWVATGSGLARVNASGLKVYYTDEGLAYGSVRSLLEDRNGDLWVGTDGGISRVREGKFLMQGPAEEALAGERIWALHQDSNGAVWVGTRGKGLFRIAQDKVSEFGSRAGLPRSIHQILEDAAGNFWMSTPSGIVRSRRQDLDAASRNPSSLLKVVSYGSAEGMQTVQMSGGIQPAGTISADGEVWFASIKGAVAIRTDAQPATHIPSAFIEEVLVDGHPVDFSNGVRIKPGTARVELHFTAPNLLTPERIGFWYMLDSFDRAWTYTSTERSASYTSLPPGDYRFQLIARNLAAPDQPAHAEVNVLWEPRFSQTKWAWALAALCTAGLVWLGFWAYARQTKQRYALLLAERARLAREMHDTVLQGCVGVSTLLEAASSFEKSNTSMLVELMNRARSQVRITLEEARQAVWDLRHDSMTGELDSSLRTFAKNLSDEAGIPIQVEISGTPVQLQPETDRNLLAATREAVRNAVAHGKPKLVRVLVHYAPEQVRIEVIDDGIGFEAGAPRIEAGHYGLLGMRERMENLGGTLRLLSNRATGTRVIAELPLSGGGRA